MANNPLTTVGFLPFHLLFGFQSHGAAHLGSPRVAEEQKVNWRPNSFAARAAANEDTISAWADWAHRNA